MTTKETADQAPAWDFATSEALRRERDLIEARMNAVARYIADVFIQGVEPGRSTLASYVQLKADYAAACERCVEYNSPIM